MSNNRDLGMNHGAGKGDVDRSNHEKFAEGLNAVEGLHPEDKSGFELVGLRKWRKTYGPKEPRTPTPESLHAAHNAIFRGLTNSSGCSSDH